MPITSGAHHLTVFTSDLDRLIAFYKNVFEAGVRYDLREPAPGGGVLRHVLIELGGGFALHPFQMPEPTGFESGSMQMGKRGHIDHLALKVEDEEQLQAIRRRLVDAGASDGTVTDFGTVRLVNFKDPDGMEGEIALWKHDERALTFQERRQEPWTE